MLPTLSQIQDWPTEHLQTAAGSWTSTAQGWDDAFTAVVAQTPLPGGTPWDGRTADAAILQVGADRLKVLGAADMLTATATIARNGAGDVQTARQLALSAVASAQAAGFIVGEDLSLTDTVGGPPPVSAARMAAAQQLDGVIRTRAAALMAVDHEVAAKITNATAGLNAIQFTDSPIQLFGPGGPPPLGPITWCLLQGTAGQSWRCSVLYPDGSVGWFWSTTDVSGGFL